MSNANPHFISPQLDNSQLTSGIEIAMQARGYRNSIITDGFTVMRDILPVEYVDDFWGAAMEALNPLVKPDFRGVYVHKEEDDPARTYGQLVTAFADKAMQSTAASFHSDTPRAYVRPIIMHNETDKSGSIKPLNLTEHKDGTVLPNLVMANGATAVTTLRGNNDIEHNVTLRPMDGLAIAGSTPHWVTKITSGRRTTLNISDGTRKFRDQSR